MTPCPHCHGTEFTLLPGTDSGKPPSLLRRLFGGAGSAPAAPPRHRCSFCGTIYSPGDPVEGDDQRLEERRARMEERMSGFRDSTVTSSMFPDEAEAPGAAAEEPTAAGRTPPKPYRSPTLEELSKVAAGIEMHKPEGIKCRKCGHFAFLVRTPESRCAACGRVYAKMDEEAEAERQEAIRRLESRGKA